jgi:L-malate glycosyltransferase
VSQARHATTLPRSPRAVGAPRPIGEAAWPARGRRLRRAFVHIALRAAMALYVALLAGARRLARPRRLSEDGRYRFLLTGTFHSENWAAAHLRPLALSGRCASITVVAATRVPAIDKVRVVAPSPWLVRALGVVAARLATFAWLTLSTRPHVIGGFHLLLNGLVAAILAPLVGARSIYFCVGGSAEVVDGGLGGENRLFQKLETPDRRVERRLLQAVAACDVVITMGTRAAAFFRQREIRTAVHVLSGGFEGCVAPAPEDGPLSDLVFVGRLAPIKRVDLLLEIVARVRTALPMVRATVVGDGALRESLEERARELGLGEHVVFAGHQRDVSPWLAAARVFVLTSESESLSLALVEAMRYGLPAVVSQVGDLGDVVEHGVNGYLVAERTPEAFADRIMDLLRDPERRRQFGAAARTAARRFELSVAVSRWNEILDGLGDRASGGPALEAAEGRSDATSLA